MLFFCTLLASLNTVPLDTRGAVTNKLALKVQKASQIFWPIFYKMKLPGIKSIFPHIFSIQKSRICIVLPPAAIFVRRNRR